MEDQKELGHRKSLAVEFELILNMLYLFMLDMSMEIGYNDIETVICVRSLLSCMLSWPMVVERCARAPFSPCIAIFLLHAAKDGGCKRARVKGAKCCDDPVML
jgi:hypothetical protein